MEVQHSESGKEGKFYIEIDGSEKAEMTYSYIDKHKISIDHTEVHEELKGQGVGYILMEAAVKFMREKDIKAIPTCSYARSEERRVGKECRCRWWRNH